MKKYNFKQSIYVLPILGIAVTTFLGFQRIGSVSIEKLHVSSKFSSGANAGFTGAPGEANCTQCHAGQVQNGDIENQVSFDVSSLPVSVYNPGETIDIHVTTTSNVAKKGFEMTALDENDNPAGVFVIGANTQLKNGTAGAINGRKYITHTSGTNSPTGWVYSWEAPATDVGPITFYLATNKTNSGGTTAGDEIYLSQYTFANASASLTEIKSKKEFQAGFSPSTNTLHMNFTNDNLKGELYLNLVDLNGKSVFTSSLGFANEGENEQKVIIPSSIKDGIYVANLFIGNYGMQQKIRIVR